MSGYGNRVGPVPADYRIKQATVRAWHTATDALNADLTTCLRQALTATGQHQANLVQRADAIQARLDLIGPNPHPSVRA